MEEKRQKYSISSENSDTTDSHVTSTSASRCSKLPSSTKSGWPRQNKKKPSEVRDEYRKVITRKTESSSHSQTSGILLTSMQPISKMG